MTFKGGVGDLREKIICKQCKNKATSKTLLRGNSRIRMKPEENTSNAV